ncbi:MAG: hypothetical protein AAGK74_00740 [Chloroflexota bacterium]
MPDYYTEWVGGQLLNATNLNSRMAELETGIVGNDTDISTINTTISGILAGTTDFTKMVVAGAAGSPREIDFETTGSPNVRRWRVGATSDAESGSNAGSNFQFVGYDDAGTFLFYAIRAFRSTQEVRVAENIRATSTTVGFFGSSGSAKPTVTGSRGGNAALNSLLQSLAGMNLITNSTTL